MHDLLKMRLKVAMDHLKDADMLIDYADEAESDSIAFQFGAEAMERMNRFRQEHSRIMDMCRTTEQKAECFEAFNHMLTMWAEKIEHKIKEL